MWVSESSNSKKYGHRCFGKIRKIFERTGILLTHDEVTFLCEHLWGCNDAEEFYRKMDPMDIEELKDWARKAKKRGKSLLTTEELSRIYA